MPVLDSARLFALVVSCSLHPDDALITALISVQSGGQPYFVGDAVSLTMRDDLTTPDAALQQLERVRASGGRPALGLLGLPVSWAQELGYTPADLFDPCKNIEIGSSFFAEFDRTCTRSVPARKNHPASFAPRRACVLRRFAAALGAHAVVSQVLTRLQARVNATPLIYDVSPSNDGAFTPTDDAISQRPPTQPALPESPSPTGPRSQARDTAAKPSGPSPTH